MQICCCFFSIFCYYGKSSLEIPGYPPQADKAQCRFTRRRRGGRLLYNKVMFWVYVIKSQKDNKLYTGMTNNLERRLAEHNLGMKSTPSTHKRGPFLLIHKEIFETRSEAREKEKWMKSGAGREGIKN